MEGKKILVTGAGGFLGSRIVDYYGNKFEVIGTTREKMDFVREDQAEAFVAQARPDVVIHCGAVSDVGRCGREPELSGLVNVKGAVNMAMACARYGARLILCSSDQVYFGSEDPLPHREDERLSPPHVYGRHKLEAERECLRVQPDSVILRLSWMYDTKLRVGREHGNLLSDIRGKLESGAELCFPVNDYRSITDVREVVANLEKAWQLPPGIYNFGSENDLSTYDLVVKILGLMKEDQTKVLRNHEAFADRPRNLRMDVSRCKEQGIVFSDTLARLWQVLAD